MLDLKRENLKKIKAFCGEKDVEVLAKHVRNLFHGEEFSVFNLMTYMDTMVILHDDKGENITRYVTMKDSEKSNYLILSADKSVEEMRFNAACMVRRVLKAIKEGGNVVSLNTSSNNSFTREEKHFACSLLMPKKELLKFVTQKKDDGNYLYLDEKKILPFKNIHAIADRFGVAFSKCCSRNFYVFDDLRDSNKGNYTVAGCTSRKDYKSAKEKYLQTDWEKDRDEVAPDHEKNSEGRVKLLIDALHYRPYKKLSDIAKRKILTNLIKFDAVNEKVIDTPEEVKQTINEYISSGGKIDKQGKLVTGDKELVLTDEQLIVIGEYDLCEKVLKENLISNMIMFDPTLAVLEKMSYKDAINSLREKDMCYFIKSLHRALFKRLEEKYDDVRGGMYRNYPVYLPMTGVSPIDWTEIPYEMENMAYRILSILRDNVNCNLSNCEYIERVNKEIHTMIRMQPFQDGNKRTSKLLQNILYQEKGIPYTLVSVNNYGAFVDGWRSKDPGLYNKLMYSLILESYGYFYGNQSTNDAMLGKRNTEKIILANKRKT